MRMSRFDTFTFLVLMFCGALAAVHFAHCGELRHAPSSLRAEATEHGCGSDFLWNDLDRECFMESMTIEIDCDTARAAQTVPHKIAIEVTWPDAEAGKVVLIDVSDAIGDEWREYCRSVEPESQPQQEKP